jgi:hypothetical protein
MKTTIPIFFLLVSFQAIFAQNYVETKNKSKSGMANPVAVFKVGRFPDPIIFFGKYTYGAVVQMPELLSIEKIDAKCRGCRPDLFEVISFDFNLVSNGSPVIMSGSKSITSEMKKFIKTLKSGSKIYFDNVKVKGPDGTIRIVPGLLLIVG